ncbi:MAG: hypothetical protein J2P27_00285 [Actinobacteria bacterium]|nr:hypothetical protein [Actinomycetota bacterium]
MSESASIIRRPDRPFESGRGGEVARALIDGGTDIEATRAGVRSRVDELLAASPHSKQQLTDAFRQACHGGQRRMAEHLLGLGADLNGTPS